MKHLMMDFETLGVNFLSDEDNTDSTQGEKA